MDKEQTDFQQAQRQANESIDQLLDADQKKALIRFFEQYQSEVVRELILIRQAILKNQLANAEKEIEIYRLQGKIHEHNQLWQFLKQQKNRITKNEAKRRRKNS